jgi:hypothetical protein
MFDIDMDVITSAGFVILSMMALGATALGYLFSVKTELLAMPLWQLIVLMAGELVACYIIAARG